MTVQFSLETVYSFSNRHSEFLATTKLKIVATDEGHIPEDCISRTRMLDENLNSSWGDRSDTYRYRTDEKFHKDLDSLKNYIKQYHRDIAEQLSEVIRTNREKTEVVRGLSTTDHYSV